MVMTEITVVKLNTENTDNLREVENWAISNCPTFLGLELDCGLDGLTYTEFYFETDKDAVMFSLRWL
jgi:hypothetical protein